MSLTIAITTPEGIVLAADSRQSYRNVTGAARIGSDSATKIYPVGNHVAVTVAGPAFLIDPKDQTKTPKSIGWFISEFLNQMSRKETVETITNKLRTYLEGIYDPQGQLKKISIKMINQIEEQGGKIVKKEKIDSGRALVADFIDKQGKTQKAVAEVMPISLIVAGYDKSDEGPKINTYMVYIPGPTKQARKHGDTSQFGANWTGQTDVVTRIIKGFDPRIESLEFFSAAKQNTSNEKLQTDLNGLQYIINWGTMTLQDAVDLAKLLIETTIAVQRYSDGINMMPGEMPGVGGSIDVAVILPNNGFKWQQRKKLSLEEPVTIPPV